MSETSNKTCVRFLHVSDIHLDAPFVGLPADKSEERRKVLRNTFMRLMQYIRDSKIDVVLISGDLFNTPHATNSTAEVLIREFSTCQDTYFIISPGKHDHYTANPIYTSGRLPDNVYIFSSDKLSRFDFEEYNVTVYGWAFMDAEMTENPIKGRHVDDGSRINLVCAYADLDAKAGTTSCPVSLADIKHFGADYYALGSRHEASRFSQAGGSKYAYAGALECMGFDEPGLGGANLITVTYNKSSQSSEHTMKTRR